MRSINKRIRHKQMFEHFCQYVVLKYNCSISGFANMETFVETAERKHFDTFKRQRRKHQRDDSCHTLGFVKVCGREVNGNDYE